MALGGNAVTLYPLYHPAAALYTPLDAVRARGGLRADPRAARASKRCPGTQSRGGRARARARAHARARGPARPLLARTWSCSPPRWARPRPLAAPPDLPVAVGGAREIHAGSVVAAGARSCTGSSTTWQRRHAAMQAAGAARAAADGCGDGRRATVRSPSRVRVRADAAVGSQLNRLSRGASSRPRRRRPRPSPPRLAPELAVGDVVTVSGELGSGKTTFVRGACRALGVTAPVTSPTFTIGHRYEGDPDVSHLDLYRFTGVSAGGVGRSRAVLRRTRSSSSSGPRRRGAGLPPTRASVRLEHVDERSAANRDRRRRRRFDACRADPGVRHRD